MLLIYGPPGIGKSTIGVALARIEGKTHTDTDNLFVGKYGAISQYIMKHGEEEFRKREGEILENCLSSQDTIITLGGGTLLRPENQVLANGSGNLITLMSDVETIVGRIYRDTANHRPLANTELEIRNLMAVRYRHYTSQKIVYIVGEAETPEEIAEKIRLLLIR